MVIVRGVGLIINSYSNFTLKTNHAVELIWAVLPFNLLILVAVPSMQTLYISSANNIKALSTETLTAQAEQWRWNLTTNKGNFKKEVSTLITPWQESLTHGDNYVEPFAYRNKNRVLLTAKNTKINITSADVLHSFFVPSLGLKMDAIPGSLQETFLHLTREGKFYGMCAEYCGFYHRIMPFSIKTIQSRVSLNF